MAGGIGFCGGTAALLDLIEEHRAAFEYDWRSRFGLSLDVMPDDMGWDEGFRLTGLLLRDPSSWVAAAVEGWAFPISREAAAVLDLFDLEHKKANKRAQPHSGRPYSQAADVVRRGNAAGRTPEQVKEILRDQFGQPEAPI